MSHRGHNEGTIFQRQGRLRADGSREDSRWVAQISVETPDGEKRVTFYGKTKREVQRKLEDAKFAKQQRRVSAITNETVEDFLSGWLASVRSSVRPTTYASYDLNVRRVTQYLGRRKLDTLTPADIQSWYLRLQDQGLSSYSVAQARRVLHVALDAAVDWELIHRNPIDATRPPRIEFREKNWLRGDEAKTLFEQTKDDPLHALWVLLTTTGLRIGEALGLKWSDFNPETQLLTVRRAVQRQKGKGLVFVDAKTDRSRRTLLLADFAGQALQRHKAIQDLHREALTDEWSSNDLIFCTTTGRPLDGTNVYRTLVRTLNKNDIRRVGLHELRHSAASLLASEGVPMKVIQGMLGHSSYTLTANTYSHLTAESQREAAQRMDSLFGESKKADRDLE